MAKINGQVVSFVGLPLTEIGHQILTSSDSQDGQHIVVEFDAEEEKHLVNGSKAGVSIVINSLIMAALKEKSPHPPKKLLNAYDFRNRIFWT